MFVLLPGMQKAPESLRTLFRSTQKGRLRVPLAVLWQACLALHLFCPLPKGMRRMATQNFHLKAQKPLTKRTRMLSQGVLLVIWQA